MAADIASAPYAPTRLTSAFFSPVARAKRVLPDLDIILQEYYQLRGWTPERVPKDEKLTGLRLK
jgi:aldehyde:ferredoxin oxidoreductase